jgi:Ca-activated chloride channel homolog
MRFADPYWLYIGLAVVTVLFVLLARAEHLKSRALELLQKARLRSRSTAPSRFRRWLRVAVVTLAVAMGFVALARPQKGMRWETLERNGIDLLLVVDTSRSMDSDDVKPTRLERAKLAIRDLVERFPGDRIGLVAFAGDAFVESPMTLDHGALLETVDALDTSVIERGGTNIGRGIDVAAEALATEPGNQKVMVLLTDGEDLEGQGLAEAKRAASAGIVIDTVGVGTPMGELVPLRDAHGATIGVVHDEDGKPVRSHLDESGLQAIAQATHGAYRPLGADGRGLDRLYDESLAPLTHEVGTSRIRRVYSEWFAIPLGLALFGILFDALLEKRWRRLAGKSKRWTGASAAAAAAGLLIVASPSPAHASVQGAAKAYAAGHYDDAAKEFERESAKNPKDARLAFNAADAAYRAGQYEAAETAFKRALTAADPQLQQRILYNQGDVLYRLGEAQKPDAREETKAQWKEAIKDYEGAIALNPKDADAIYNRDFVQRKLKALEEKQKEQPQKNDSKSDSKNDSKDDKKDSSGSKGKDDAKGGGSGQDQKKGASGDKEGKGSSSGKPSSSGSAQGQAPQPSPSSQGQGQAQNGKAGTHPSPGQGSNPGPAMPPGGTEGAQPGRLSARDARALLGSLRGEEHKGLSHGTASGQPTDDAPQKDW